jgi:hypothetical protein
VAESNVSTEDTSSRTREPNDSTNGFCHREPGSMKLRSAPAEAAPVAQSVGGHLGAVVHPDELHPDELRAGAALADDLVEHPGSCGRRRSSGPPASPAPRGCIRRRRGAVSACGRGWWCRTGSPRPRHGWGARPAAAWRARWTPEPLPLAFPLPHRSNPGRTTLPHVELQRRDGDGGRVVAAACFGRPEQGTQQIEQQSRAGPFAGPKPESMMLPCGARRSGQRPIRVGSRRRANSLQAGHASVTRSIA